MLDAMSTTQLSVGVDLSDVDDVLDGKVMVFDPIVQLLKVFLPIMDAFKVIAHLMENYKINKETVQKKAHKDLLETLAKGAMEIYGLKSMISGKNFFTVRTAKLRDFCNGEFGERIDKGGFQIINRV